MRSVIVALLAFASAVQAQTPATLVVEVRAEDQPVVGAVVLAGKQRAETGADGRVEFIVPAGAVTVTVTKEGLVDVRHDVTVPASGVAVTVELVALPDIEEDVVVVASTRTGRRVEDQPTRVEVLGREEIEEKMLMTPGDIVMMLNEMGGLRVQATSPSIGAASVRVQGMKGRYTRFLSDGLPLFGQQVGGLGLLQIPPMDLGQVEVIKGVASALYGAGAMGGVVNLLSRRPPATPAVDLLVNQSTLGGTDGVAFVSTPAGANWRLSLLGGAHRQSRNDRDDDGWADVAGYARGVVRPRLFWDGGSGRSAFVTAGLTIEDRTGGTLPGARLVATGAPYGEALNTRRYDVGGTVQTLLRDRYVLTVRGAAAWQRHDHRFGEVRERDAHDTTFGEVALRGAAGRHTWVVGTAYERDAYRPADVPRFAYTYDVPGAFVQDDVDLTSWLSVSAGARLDGHSEYGAFVSPRLAGLIRAGGLDQPPLGGPRLLCHDAADGGNRGGGPDSTPDTGAAAARARLQRVVGCDPHRRSGHDHRHGVRVAHHRSGRGRPRHPIRALQPRRRHHEPGRRAAGHRSARAVGGHRHLHLRALARGRRTAGATTWR